MQGQAMREKKKTGRPGARLAAVLLLCALTAGAKHWRPQAAQALQTWSVGQEDNRVLQAFAALGSSMEQGDGLGQAVQAFCAEMTGDGIS